MTHGVIDAAEAFRAKHIVSDAHHEQVIKRLVEDRFDRHSRVGATQHQRVGLLRRNRSGPQRQTERDGTDWDDDLANAFSAQRRPRHLCDDRRQPAIAIAENPHRRLCIGRGIDLERQMGVVAIDQVHGDSFMVRVLQCHQRAQQ